jgi:hypothetical protein
MREILFRGKCNETCKYNGQWIEGFYREDDGKPIIVRSTGPGFGYFCEPDSIGQYTGLTDKDDRKIFENGYMIIDNKTYKVIFDNAEYILTNIFNCDIITLKNNSIKGVFVDEI